MPAQYAEFAPKHEELITLVGHSTHASTEHAENGLTTDVSVADADNGIFWVAASDDESAKPVSHYAGDIFYQSYVIARGEGAGATEAAQYAAGTTSLRIAELKGNGDIPVNAGAAMAALCVDKITGQGALVHIGDSFAAEVNHQKIGVEPEVDKDGRTTRLLDGKGGNTPSIRQVQLQGGDRFVLCTPGVLDNLDLVAFNVGLRGRAGETRLANDVLTAASQSDPQQAASKLADSVGAAYRSLDIKPKQAVDHYPYDSSAIVVDFSPVRRHEVASPFLDVTPPGIPGASPLADQTPPTNEWFTPRSQNEHGSGVTYDATGRTALAGTVTVPPLPDPMQTAWENGGWFTRPGSA